MLLRCSICKGQFEIEPSPNKTTIFCSHCGAPLEMRPKSRQSMSAQAPQALNALGDPNFIANATAPEDSAGESLENIFSPQVQVEETTLIAPRPIRPNAPQSVSKEYPLTQPDPSPSANSLADLAKTHPTADYSQPALRRQSSQKKNANIAIIVVIVTVLAAGLILGVVLMIHSINKPAEPAPVPAVRHDPGELFPKKSEPQPAPTNAPDDTPADTPPAQTPSEQ